MRLYDIVTQDTARRLTLRYSSSFGMASRLFSKDIRQDIYNIYGLVRVADEVVDSYRSLYNGSGQQAAAMLGRFEAETYQAISRGYSADIVIHAFQLTANRYDIGKDLLEPFFESMRMDLQPQHYTPELYQEYIYGSAEVIGLMCLKVFTGGRPAQYRALAAGSRKLGAAYQKVNFLRDMATDRTELGRSYFPGVGQAGLTEESKQRIVDEISADFVAAQPYIDRLPSSSRAAVWLSYAYYSALLEKLRHTPAAVIGRQRLRVSQGRKLLLLAQAKLRQLSKT